MVYGKLFAMHCDPIEYGDDSFTTFFGGNNGITDCPRLWKFLESRLQRVRKNTPLGISKILDDYHGNP